jgi:type 1 fimbriae regulatory protein FimB
MSTFKYWTPEELLGVLAEARKVSARNHLIVLLGYKHGLRASEIARLRVKDVANGRLDCKRLKGSLHTNRPLESNDNVLLDEKRALVAYLSERPTDESPFLFVSRLSARARERAAALRTDADRWGSDVDRTARGISRDAIAEIFEDATFRAGIEAGRRNPHCAKHSLGAHLYRAGVDTFALQQILGHRDAKSTAVYAGVTQDEAHVKARSAMSTIFA